MFYPVINSGEYRYQNNREYVAGGSFVFATSHSMTYFINALGNGPGVSVRVITYDSFTGDGTGALSFGENEEENLQTFLTGKDVTLDSGDVITVTASAFAFGGQAFSFFGRFPEPEFLTDIQGMEPV